MERYEQFVKISDVIKELLNYMETAVRILDSEIKQFSDLLAIPFFNNLNCIQEVTNCIILEQYEMILWSQM